MSQKVLIITGDAGESYECLFARHRLLEAGHVPVIAAPSRRGLHLVIHDFEPGWDTYIERPGYKVAADVSLDDVSAEGFDALLLLGGRAPEYLRHDRRVLRLVSDFAVADRWIFAICHGIQILVTAGLARDRCFTCYEHVRSEVEMAGGTWVGEQAVRDGRIVTGQTWQSHPEFYRLVFQCLAETPVPA